MQNIVVPPSLSEVVVEGLVARLQQLADNARGEQSLTSGVLQATLVADAQTVGAVVLQYALANYLLRAFGHETLDQLLGVLGVPSPATPQHLLEQLYQLLPVPSPHFA